MCTDISVSSNSGMKKKLLRGLGGEQKQILSPNVKEKTSFPERWKK